MFSLPLSGSVISYVDGTVIIVDGITWTAVRVAANDINILKEWFHDISKEIRNLRRSKSLHFLPKPTS